MKNVSKKERLENLQMDLKDVQFELESIERDKKAIEPDAWFRAMNVVRWRKLKELNQREQFAKEQQEQFNTLIKALQEEKEGGN